MRVLLNSVFLSSIIVATLEADTSREMDECPKGPHAMHMSVRHIEAKGIGYNQGYTSIDGFFSSVNSHKEAWLQFVDLRGHAFNDGKFAANVGYGARYIARSCVWGGNLYYDYRTTRHHRYNQVNLGFEALGRVWDFRASGSLPVGRTKSSFYHTELGQKREFAMKGLNAEVGVHVDTYQHAPLYFAAGPYYLEGLGKKAWGGELRAVIDIYDYLRLEGNTSYDNIFHWIGQGQISLIIPFGPKRTMKKRDENSCSKTSILYKRANQRVDRFEIIPVDTKSVR